MKIEEIPIYLKKIKEMNNLRKISNIAVLLSNFNSALADRTTLGNLIIAINIAAIDDEIIAKKEISTSSLLIQLSIMNLPNII